MSGYLLVVSIVGADHGLLRAPFHARSLFFSRPPVDLTTGCGPRTHVPLLLLAGRLIQGMGTGIVTPDTHDSYSRRKSAR